MHIAEDIKIRQEYTQVSLEAVVKFWRISGEVALYFLFFVKSSQQPLEKPARIGQYPHDSISRESMS